MIRIIVLENVYITLNYNKYYPDILCSLLSTFVQLLLTINLLLFTFYQLLFTKYQLPTFPIHNPLFKIKFYENFKRKNLLIYKGKAATCSLLIISIIQKVNDGACSSQAPYSPYYSIKKYCTLMTMWLYIYHERSKKEFKQDGSYQVYR